MFGVFVNSVLPVASIFFIGLWMGRKNMFQLADASLFFRFVGQIAVPAIIFSILLSTDFTSLDLNLILLYLLAEFLVYGLGFFIARFTFRLDTTYAILIGMACSFSNHVLFVLPISNFIFDPITTLPIRGAIAIDCLSLTFSTVWLDVVNSSRSGKPFRLFTHSKNPLIISLLICSPFVLGIINSPVIFMRLADFIALSAAPLALFASGILLSEKVSLTGLKIAFFITCIKSIVYPLVSFFILVKLMNYPFDSARTILMVAAAPVGLMPMTFASRYKVETSPIALSMLWTFFISLILIPMIATV
tara:strand:+ start:1960 stop:2871 length:912 start_codon:yes stop_codon:yes gene_type:complete